MKDEENKMQSAAPEQQAQPEQTQPESEPAADAAQPGTENEQTTAPETPDKKKRPLWLKLLAVFAAALAVLVLLAVVCLGAGIGMETISKWGPWMDLVSIYIIPIGATLGAVSWFFIMKKDDLLAAVNTGSGKRHGALWYNVGRFVYVPLAALLCGVALIAHVAF